MTTSKRWLDELPLDSSERELLLVGKAARPAQGSIDANWRALSVALTATAAASGATSAGAALKAVSASAKVGAASAASKAAGAGLWVTVGKSLAVGALVGVAAMGAGSLVERSLSRNTPAQTTSKAAPVPPSPQRAAEPKPTPNAPTEPGAVPPAPPMPALPASTQRERAAVNPTEDQPSAPPPVTAEAVSSAVDLSASLSQQARELAELKRLIDSGAATEALRRLEQNLSTGAPSVLSEERDALYVQALARAQRHAQARTFARRFLARYPHSPYFEAMRRFLTDQ